MRVFIAIVALVTGFFGGAAVGVVSGFVGGGLAGVWYTAHIAVKEGLITEEQKNSLLTSMKSTDKERASKVDGKGVCPPCAEDASRK